MDCITLDRPGKQRIHQRNLLIAFVILISGILIYKAIDERWFVPVEPLDLSNAPAILFFNRGKGCECEMVVYTAAERQIDGWADEGGRGIPIIRIDLDRRPDLGIQYHIVRAHAIFLVDRDGGILYSQKDAVSDIAPLNLDAVTAAIEELPDGK